MHIEVLVEDSSGAELIKALMVRIVGSEREKHSWRIHRYKGVGHIPKGLTTKADPAKRALLDQLPKLLSGYGKTPGIDAVVVVLDSDRRDCKEFLADLRAIQNRCDPAPVTLFRLAIEEMESWYLGDRQALLAAYPKAKKEVLARYRQDNICGTWELLADAVYPGGHMAIKKAGWPLPGQIKHEWAKNIPPHMNVDVNVSPSFNKFCDGVRRILAAGT